VVKAASTESAQAGVLGAKESGSIKENKAFQLEDKKDDPGSAEGGDKGGDKGGEK
jgi:hypothetical protein